MPHASFTPAQDSPLSVPLANPALRRGEWPRLAMLLIIVGIAWAFVAALHDVWGPDETRYTQVAKELLPRQNWLLLTLQGKPYNEKPPLPFWMLAAMLKISGGVISPLLLRVPAILMGLGTLALVYDIGRRRFGREAGWLAALILITMPVFGDDGPHVRLDLPLTAWTTLAVWAWLTRPEPERMGALRLVLFWLGIICGFLTKGPLVLLVALPVVLAECWADRGRGKTWRPLRTCGMFWGFLVLLAALAIWFIGQVHGAGLQFVLDQIRQQTVERFVEGDHAEPFYYYFYIIFVSTFAPWTFAMIPLGISLWRRRGAWPRAVAPIIGWVVVPFIILSISHGKRQVYLMPLAPGLAVLLGWYLDDLITQGARVPWLTRVCKAVAIIGGVLCVAALAVLPLVPAARQRLPMAFGASYGVLIACAIAFVATSLILARRQASLRAAIYSIVAMAAIGLALNGYLVERELNRARTPKLFSQRVTALLAQRHEHALSAIEDAAAPEYHVYGNYDVDEFDRGEVRKGLIAGMAPVVVGMEKDDPNSSATLSRAGYRASFSDTVAGRPLIVYERASDGATSNSLAADRESR